MATAPEPASSGVLLRFGIFELDTDAERLYKDGRFVRVQPRPFKLLRLLAENGGQVITREEIEKAWGSDASVDFEQSMNLAIRQVREALGEDAERPLYLQTVPKRGYRLVAAVERVARQDDAADDAIFRPPTDGKLNKLLWMDVTDQKLLEQQRHARRVLTLKAAAAAFLLALIAVFLMLR
jgi:DNA-binding winged helix-turn-helix (wHTH) protein